MKRFGEYIASKFFSLFDIHWHIFTEESIHFLLILQKKKSADAQSTNTSSKSLNHQVPTFERWMGSCIAELLSVVYQGCMSKNSVCQSTFVCYSTCPSTFPVSERCFDVNIRGNWLTFTVLSLFKKRAEDQSQQCLAWWYMWTWRSAAACVSMPSGPVRCFNVLIQKQQRGPWTQMILIVLRFAVVPHRGRRSICSASKHRGFQNAFISLKSADDLCD